MQACCYHPPPTLDVRLVDPPVRHDRTLALAKHRGQHRQELDQRPMDGGMIDDHTSLGHHLFDMTDAQRVAHRISASPPTDSASA